jgi:PIN domain
MANKNAEPNPVQDAEATGRIQELLERGRSVGIAIDSNYYINGSGGTLDIAFRDKLASGNGRFLHLVPSIWEREIKRHIRSRIENAKEKVRNVSERDISDLYNADAMSAIKALKAATNAVDSAKTTDSLWTEFVVETHATVVHPAADSATTVLDWYFDQRPPFETSGDKKHEFPDAFALHSLSRFAEDNNLHVVVVITKDRGAYEHCTGTEKLLAFRDVRSALGAFDAKDLIEQRRQLSIEASEAMDEERLAKLMERLIERINRPYEHRRQPWSAVTNLASHKIHES